MSDNNYYIVIFITFVQNGETPVEMFNWITDFFFPAAR